MVANWKYKEIENLTGKISKAKVVGLVKISKIPSKQFQQMRKSLAGKAEITVSRSNLLKRSFEKAGIKGLNAHMEGSMGIILTDLNPFKLNRILKDNKISAPAKAGSVSPRDIVIPAGETSLPAGPIIGDLQKAGVKAQIQGGKIVVMQDSQVVKAGDRISGELALVLTRLGIEPIEIGFDLRAAHEEGLVYSSDVLSIDEQKVLSDIQLAHAQAMNLALNANVYNKETIKLFVSDAHGKALSLAINAEVFNKETIELLLAKANREMMSVASRVPDALDEELKSTVSSAPAPAAAKEEKKEKKQEAKEEKSEDDAASGLASLFG